MSSSSDRPTSVIDPIALLTLPVPGDLIAAHRESWRILGAHPHKDIVTDMDEPDYLFDVKAIQEAIDASVLPVCASVWPTGYAEATWHLNVTDGVVSQGEGSILDLIWATTMPPCRAETPVLVVKYAGGQSLLDGSHRLARAFIDGATHHPSLVFERADALEFRRRRSD